MPAPGVTTAKVQSDNATGARYPAQDPPRVMMPRRLALATLTARPRRHRTRGGNEDVHSRRGRELCAPARVNMSGSREPSRPYGEFPVLWSAAPAAQGFV